MKQEQINISVYPATIGNARVEFMGKVPLGKRTVLDNGVCAVTGTDGPWSMECSDVIIEVGEFCCGLGNV